MPGFARLCKPTFEQTADIPLQYFPDQLVIPKCMKELGFVLFKIAPLR
jgi:hypothetical protein